MGKCGAVSEKARRSQRHKMKPHSWQPTAIVLLVLFLCGGCGRVTNRAELHGTVTLDGEPLEQGAITLFPTGPTKGPAAGTAIVDGSYSIAAEKGPAIGTNRVEIRSARATGKTIPIRNEPEIVEILPDRYHNQSVLTVEIEPGQNVANFQLHSK